MAWLTSGGPNQPKDVTLYLTLMLVPIKYLCVRYSLLYVYFGFCL